MMRIFAGGLAVAPSGAATPCRLHTRFRRAEAGATAVEFGLVALPFFALLFAIMETAFAFWSSQVLETAVANASREIYTGQFQQNPAYAGKTTIWLAAQFKSDVCANVTALFDCAANVQVDVRTFDDNTTPNVPLPITAGEYDTSSYGYQAPGASKITVVRASMKYPSFTSFLNGTTGLANGYRLIMASSTFRTEPYSPAS